MYIPRSIEEISDLLNGLPTDVSRVLGAPEETHANAILTEKSGIPEGALIRLNDFYISVIAKKNPIGEIPSFLKGSLGISDPAAIKELLTHFMERLSWYGDYFPEISEKATEWDVILPAGKPLILKVRQALAVEATEARLSESATASGSVSIEKLALVPALGKYPRLGEQQITKERIRVKNQPEPARPSLANWIRVYRDELGVGYHEPMVRGKFLFDSENGRHLTSEDRERLNLVLRSIEENVLLEIDTDKPEIVFPEFAPTPKKPVPVPQPVIVSRPEPSRVVPASASVPHENRPVPQVPTPVAPPIPVAPVRNPLPSRPVSPAPNPQPAPVQDASFVSRPPVQVSPAPQIPPQAPPRRPVSFSPAPPSNLPIGNPESPIGIPAGNANVASGISFSRPAGITPSVEPFGEVGSQATKGNSVRPADLSPAMSPSVSGGNISFSSSHSLPVESDDRKGEFSIRKQDVQPLPSGRNAFGAREERNETSIPSSKPSTASSSPASDDPHAQPAANANPFRIHPVSFHEDLPDHGAGKIVS